MGGGTATNKCGGNTGVKVGNISGSPVINYAKGAIHTGAIECGQKATATGASVGIGIGVLQNLNNAGIDPYAYGNLSGLPDVNGVGPWL